MLAGATPVGRHAAWQVLEGAAPQELATMAAELVAHAAGSVCPVPGRRQFQTQVDPTCGREQQARAKATAAIDGNVIIVTVTSCNVASHCRGTPAMQCARIHQLITESAHNTRRQCSLTATSTTLIHHTLVTPFGTPNLAQLLWAPGTCHAASRFPSPAIMLKKQVRHLQLIATARQSNANIVAARAFCEFHTTASLNTSNAGPIFARFTACQVGYKCVCPIIRNIAFASLGVHAPKGMMRCMTGQSNRDMFVGLLDRSSSMVDCPDLMSLLHLP